MPAVSIIIPVYNAEEYACECLDSVYVATDTTAFEVIVVNNGSSSCVGDWLAAEAQRRQHLTVLSFDRPLGFAGAVNAGAAVATHEFLVLLNSDSVVTDGWLEGLIETMLTDERIGIAGTVTNHSGPGPQLVATGPNPNRRSPPIYESRRLFFFCVMIRRKLWDSLQGLDERYRVGTYEDDDFCLRARRAGWRMAVNPNVFIRNHASRTFKENNIDREELLHRNEKIFLERASSLSRSHPDAGAEKQSAASTTVIVPVSNGKERQLIDSLYSLANQTMNGFEALVVALDEAELPPIPSDLEGLLRLRIVRVPGDAKRGPGYLCNAGIAATQNDFVAWLPAGDLWFPYHLETLHKLLLRGECQVAYSGWCVAIHRADTTLRAAVSDFESGPERLASAPWAPLACWLHYRGCLPPEGFREDLQSFADWEFTLRLSQQTMPHFHAGITCERNRWIHDNAETPEDAELVMESFPSRDQAVIEGRDEFLAAVRRGVWEETLVAARHEREYRVRRMLRQQRGARNEQPAMESGVSGALQRIAKVRACQEKVSPVAGRLDFIFLNILGWTDLTQRPHHFAAGLAKRGHRVFWVDVNLTAIDDFSGAIAPRLLGNNLWEIQLPGHAGGIYHFVWNEAAVDLMTKAIAQFRDATGIGHTIQLVNFPGWTPLAQSLRRHFGWPILYDCLDDQFAFSDLYGQTAAQSFESDLTKTCDALITSGRRLHQMKAAQGRDSTLILNAADYDIFSNGVSSGFLDDLPCPIVGFFGVFADWIDSEWVRLAAQRFPHFSFVYIGCPGFANHDNRERWLDSTTLPNIRVLPRADLQSLATHLAQFDVCTMPFRDLAITRTMHAVKIYEYLAAGKHVLAPMLPEVRPFAEAGLLSGYEDHEESFVLLETLAQNPPSAEQIAARKAFAARNDWNERLDRLMEALPALSSA